jgi:hypothetical protein
MISLWKDILHCIRNTKINDKPKEVLKIMNLITFRLYKLAYEIFETY